jgi:hypothetical protein
VGGAGASDAPQLSQNASPGSTAAPHDGQVLPVAGVVLAGVPATEASTGAWAGAGPVSAEPQLSQNASPGRTGAPHVGQTLAPVGCATIVDSWL